MKKISLLSFAVLFMAVSAILTSCSQNSYSPSSPYGSATNTFTPTPTPTGPTSTPTNSPTVTLTFTPTNTATVTPTATVTNTPTITNTPTNTATLTPTATITDTPTVTNTPTPKTVTIMVISASGSYRYSLDGTTALSAPITLYHGDSILWSLSNPSIHPLYLDNGASCLVTNLNTGGSYTYSSFSVGTYHFHCGNHGSCSPSNSTCPGAICTGMTADVIVQ